MHAGIWYWNRRYFELTLLCNNSFRFLYIFQFKNIINERWSTLYIKINRQVQLPISAINYLKRCVYVFMCMCVCVLQRVHMHRHILMLEIEHWAPYLLSQARNLPPKFIYIVHSYRVLGYCSTLTEKYKNNNKPLSLSSGKCIYGINYSL